MPNQSCLASRNIRSLARDRQGRLWVGTNRGLARLEGTACTHIRQASTARGSFITSIYQDEHGTVWVGAMAGGLSRVMDGFALVQKIRERSALERTPVIMLTSAGRPGDSARCRQLEIARSVAKPVRPADLRAAILSVVNRDDQRRLAEDAAVTATTTPLQPPLQILVADDVVVNQRLLLRMLEKLGHQVTVVANGQEACDIAAVESFDLVLMEVQMPVMDGLAATAAIRQREQDSDRRTPIIAVTAHAMQGDKDRFLEAGMDGYISKPVGRAELVEAIALALSSPRPTPSPPAVPQ